MAGQGVADNAATLPDKVAVIEGDRSLTYAELYARANRLARALAARGAKPGGRVAVMLPNSVEYAEAGCATALAQCSFVPVNWHLKSAELAWILTDSAADVLIAWAPLGAVVDEARAAASGCAVLLVDGEPGSVAEGEDYESALAAESSDPLEGAWGTPSWMFYTSGTTGRPKGVVHGELVPGTMELAQQGLIALWGFRTDDVHLLAGPGYHAGPGGYCFTSLFVGCTVVLLREWSAKAWLEAVDRHKVTTTFMTPAHFIRILEVPEQERAAYDLSSLRLIIHAGAPTPLDVKRRMLELLPECEISELYGASEGGVTKITRKEWQDRVGSVGQPWPGVEVRILDDDGKPLPPGQTGVIYVVPQGGRTFHYHQDQEKTSNAWKDGAFTVGDIGHLDEDGYLYITDRVNDMVLWGGVNIYPREIEEVLHTHPSVVDCAVFGIPDERYGEVLKAVVECRDAVSGDDLMEHVRERLADFKVPSVVELVDELPRDPNGKVLKRLLK
jgi:long-chain acyl-CoA synthetase